MSAWQRPDASPAVNAQSTTREIVYMGRMFIAKEVKIAARAAHVTSW